MNHVPGVALIYPSVLPSGQLQALEQRFDLIPATDEDALGVEVNTWAISPTVVVVATTSDRIARELEVRGIKPVRVPMLKSFAFWKDLLAFLGFEIKPDGNHFDATDGHTNLCVQVTKPDHQEPGFHRKRTGLGHIAFQVDSADMVDAFVNDFLEPRQIETLYGGAKAYPDYTPDYYAVYFEDPDRIKVEVVYEG
jgi:catechol 2,3-dioxygenase-like lactoylglutathione lyase family enzyme